jgi:hypothetical protein
VTLAIAAIAPAMSAAIAAAVAAAVAAALSSAVAAAMSSAVAAILGIRSGASSGRADINEESGRSQHQRGCKCHGLHVTRCLYQSLFPSRVR